MLSQFTSWLLGLVKSFFGALWDFVSDAFIGTVEMCANAFVSLSSSIPVPQFLEDGLQSVYANIDPGVSYILTALGIPTALGIIGAGFTFRITRKALSFIF
ncbi:MAG: DUF2523 family protein [Roseateles sp.]|uniref:DUF2523 family protein n=1 Tax=Roseateles sp. TaxID=1971397 RepID=UPI0039EB0A99